MLRGFSINAIFAALCVVLFSFAPSAAAQGNAGSVQAALDQISARDWLNGSSEVLIDRVLRAAPVSTLEAAASANPRAQALLGYIHEHGLRGYTVNHAEAARYFRLAADAGVARAQANLAVLYMSGSGVEQDGAEAMRWARLAADQGQTTGQTVIGYLYSEGLGVAEDPAESVRWYLLAADGGNAHAQMTLGCLYASGYGVARSDAEAVRYYRLSAAQNYPPGLYYLGVMYRWGRGVDPDGNEASRYYTLAARQGYEPAQEALTERGETW